jgi:hypothetical protein
VRLNEGVTIKAELFEAGIQHGRHKPISLDTQRNAVMEPVYESLVVALTSFLDIDL